jgi:predicted small lipoprotein YifL
VTALRRCRIGFGLALAFLAACGIKGDPEPPEPETETPAPASTQKTS